MIWNVRRIYRKFRSQFSNLLLLYKHSQGTYEFTLEIQILQHKIVTIRDFHSQNTLGTRITVIYDIIYHCKNGTGSGIIIMYMVQLVHSRMLPRANLKLRKFPPKYWSSRPIKNGDHGNHWLYIKSFDVFKSLWFQCFDLRSRN